MIKNFSEWNEQKIKTELRDSKKIKCKKREIWMCLIGENLGSEISKGKPFLRPVLILNNYLGGDLVSAIPATTKHKKHFDHFFFQLSHPRIKRKSWIMLNQVRVISKKRLIRDLHARISKKQFQCIKKRLQELT